MLVPGGRLCTVVSAVSISRRRGGRHYVLPLPSDIQVRSRLYGLDNLTPIMWQKIGNIAPEGNAFRCPSCESWDTVAREAS